jgi:hypothetical protein
MMGRLYGGGSMMGGSSSGWMMSETGYRQLIPAESTWITTDGGHR